MEKHFVTFFSPGTFVAETTIREIESWDVQRAIQMADSTVERYNATPFAFKFSTRTRGDEDLDSKETASSCFYFLGGTIESLEEIEARNDPKEAVLLSNMKSNGWNHVVVNENSWKWTQPLEENDVVLDYTPPLKKEAVGE